MPDNNEAIVVAIKTTDLPTSNSITASDTIVSNVSNQSRKVSVNTILESDGFSDNITQAEINAIVDDVFS